jgi:hypothetical protein
MKLTPKSSCVTVAITVAMLAIVPMASASIKYKMYEIIPNGTPEKPIAFVAEAGGTIFQSAKNNSVYCTKETAKGEFTSASEGTETQWFTGCTLEGVFSKKVQTPGAAAGEIVTEKTPIESVYDTTTKGLAIVANPLGQPKGTFISELDVGTIKSGPVTGAALQTVSPSGTKASKFVFHLAPFGSYDPPKAWNGVPKSTFMRWTDFSGETGQLFEPFQEAVEGLRFPNGSVEFKEIERSI